ncbi:MAG: DUF2793 domain-containing protein [Alphaproteobacteria bacterium]|nr:MAG: DUF2793 domain-containing protein [Alphaproteobacteria bacterium]
MSETANLSLPLLQPAQAQKHVTVNEALLRVDAAAMLVLEALDVTQPPATAAEGQAWAVGPGAVNEWLGQDGKIALSAGGGWAFLTPASGWRAFVRSISAMAVHDGQGWRPDLVTLSAGGAGLQLRALEFDHVLGAEAVSTTTTAIPAGALVIGVTGRVIEDITGGPTSWSLGVTGAENRYGSGIGVAKNAWVRGLTQSPQAYYSPTPLVLTPDAGSFASGRVRLSIHLAELALPDAV